jgi:hypothetical protein
MGNALTWSSESEVKFPSNSGNTMYDYVFTLASVPNPNKGNKRMNKNSVDMTYPDLTPNTLADNLWTKYEQYSTKFCLAVYELVSTPTANAAPNVYSARTYGVLHHAWLGFNKVNPVLYVLDGNFAPVSCVEAIEGLQSKEYVIATGTDLTKAKNAGSKM